MPLSLDNPRVIYKDKDSRSAAKNKKIFMKNYGIEFSFQSIFVQDAKLLPLNPAYTLQLVNHVMPKSPETTVITYTDEGK